jgi:phospholipid/cholesterol/gamma-HCH transport system permease protein
MEAGTSGEPEIEFGGESGRRALKARGVWTTAHAARLMQLAEMQATAGGTITEIDMNAVERLDTMGAWALIRLARANGGEAAAFVMPDRFRGLFDDVGQAPPYRPPARRWRGPVTALDGLGRATAGALADLADILAMVGAIAMALVRALFRPKAFRLTSIVHHLDRVGWRAIGIILLITFLIGGIIAQQGIFNFRRFGAEDYVVNLVGILVLREIGVLIVAIMVAGRSGSAYTAELGSMKMREEIDALRTMGVDPVEVLVLPRVIAIVLALPILTFIGSMAALAGGELVAWLYGGMSPAVFATRLRAAVSFDDFSVGLIKAPVMAFIIGAVACAEGFKVAGSTESLGNRTTASVVKAIFLVIVLDGFFAIFFAAIGV